MWEGEITPELIEYAKEYKAKFGCSPDCYDAVLYETFDLVFFIKAILASIRANIDLDEYLYLYPDADYPPIK